MTQFEAVEPQKIKFSMTATYTLEDWVRISEQLKKGSTQVAWPASTLCSDILDMVIQAKEKFYPKS